MNFLIVGSNFNNKGAQSMLFISIDEIKKRFPESTVYFATPEKIDESKFDFKTVYYTENTKRKALNKAITKGWVLESFVIDVAKCFLRRRKFTDLGDLKRIIKTIDCIVDVSGYCYGDKWDYQYQETMLNNIRLAKFYNIPIYLMPQSLGPFENYTGDRAILIEEMRDLFQYPRIIFAREHEGYEQVISKFGIKNVQISTDLVLQNSGINAENIYKERPQINLPLMEGNKKERVAIIPNRQCFRFKSDEALLSLYEKIILELLANGKRIYVFRHAAEDLEVCLKIKDKFANDNRVLFLENEFSCLEYDAFITEFEFIICSRFHGLVHAYRNAVPAIALGWAIKYKELLNNVGQSEYSFDLSSGDFDDNNVILALKKIISQNEQESETIRVKVKKIQEENCFDLVEQDLKELIGS